VSVESRSGGTAVAERNSGSNGADCEVVVIGAGPYGLSAAAHLKSKGVSVRVFGKPMDFWATKMPAGMLLRSPRVASNISNPTRAFQLEQYEKESGISAETRLKLSTFVGYGQWLQRGLVPDLDHTDVEAVETANGGFRTILADGTSVNSNRVVVAAGIGPFQRIPKELKDFPSALVSHCYSGTDITSFSGKHVVVIGAGQSALESAVLLAENGATVEILVRDPQVRWIGMHPRLHNLGPISSMLYSEHDVGPAGISKLVAAPNLMRMMPLGWRDKIRKRAVRSAGAPWLIDRLKPVTIKIHKHVTEAKEVGGRVVLKLDDGSTTTADHVLLGTGYNVDISRFGFLPSRLLEKVQTYDGYPILKPGFGSSLPGLHFIGATAARTFGPLLYFVAGTEFASRNLASDVVKNRVSR
jgi:FAD-dependent urate hydroxylase